jgi:hypothetical protein
VSCEKTEIYLVGNSRLLQAGDVGRVIILLLELKFE